MSLLALTIRKPFVVTICFNTYNHNSIKNFVLRMIFHSTNYTYITNNELDV